MEPAPRIKLSRTRKLFAKAVLLTGVVAGTAVGFAVANWAVACDLNRSAYDTRLVERGVMDAYHLVWAAVRPPNWVA